MRPTTDGSRVIVVRFEAYFPPLGYAALPVGVAAQISDCAGIPMTPIASAWIPDDSAQSWRDTLDRAQAAGSTDLAALAEAWSEGMANGITTDLWVQMVALPPSVEAGPELTEALVDLVYWHILTEHGVLLAEADGLGLLTA